MLFPLHPVRDHNWQGALTGALSAVQKQDRESPWGQRPVLLSRHGHLLEGYGLARRPPLETMLRAPLLCSVDKPSRSATVELPDLLAGVNLVVRTPEPYLRIAVVLGAVADLFYTPEGYAPESDDQPLPLTTVYTDWRPIKSGLPATSLLLQLPEPLLTRDFALVLDIGVLLGTIDYRGAVLPVPYRGCGRILKVI